MDLEEICTKYTRRIGNDVGWMSQIVQEGYKIMKKSYNHEGILSLSNQALQASQRMQIIYLVNLFESFMQDYIGFRDNLNEEEMNTRNFWANHLSSEIKNWDNYCDNYQMPINNSRSFMNVRYSLFILKEKYNLNLPSNLESVIPELGSLRNCLVHNDGVLTSKDKGGGTYKETMIETIKFLEINNEQKQLNELNKNDFINKVTFDLQTFVELCGKT